MKTFLILFLLIAPKALMQEEAELARKLAGEILEQEYVGPGQVIGYSTDQEGVIQSRTILLMGDEVGYTLNAAKNKGDFSLHVNVVTQNINKWNEIILQQVSYTDLHCDGIIDEVRGEGNTEVHKRNWKHVLEAIMAFYEIHD
jgi:hypothetical protein